MSSMTWILLFGMAVCIHYNSAIPSKQADSTEPDLTDALLSLDDVPERELREAETGGLNNATVHGNGGQLLQRSVYEDTDEQNDGDDVVDGELQTRSTDDGYPSDDDDEDDDDEDQYFGGYSEDRKRSLGYPSDDDDEDDDDEDQYFGGYSEDRKRSLDLDDEIDGDDKIDDVDDELQTRSANDGYPSDDDDEDDDDEDQYFGGYSEDRKRSLDDEIHGDDENDGDGELHTRSNDYDDDDDDDDVDDYADFLSSYKFARELDDSVDNTLDKNGSIDAAKRDTEESGLSNHDESDAIDMAQFINKLSRRALPKEAKKVDGLADSLSHTSSGITELHIVEPYDFEINEDNKDTELIMNPENSNNKRQTEHKEQTQENTAVDKSHLFKITNPLATRHSMLKPDEHLTDHFTNVEMSQSITKRSFTASIPKTTSVPTTIPVPKATSGNMYMRTNSDVDDSNAIKDKTKPATPKPKMIVPHIVIKPLGGKPVGPLAKAEQLNREYGLLFSPYPKVEVAWHEPYLYRNCWITALLSSGNGFPSNCHPGGTYAPKQCYLQRCWCVNKDGSPQETDYKRFHYKIDGAMLECTQNY